jgi:PhnB protein
MTLNTYINYRGNCAEAFKFYEQHLGGQITMLLKHSDNPGTSHIPADWKDAVLHARLNLAGVELFGADIPHAEPMRSAYLSLTTGSVEEADRVYAILSQGGETFMPMQETFFADRFAMLRDRFGTSWMIQHPKPQQA